MTNGRTNERINKPNQLAVLYNMVPDV